MPDGSNGPAQPDLRSFGEQVTGVERHQHEKWRIEAGDVANCSKAAQLADAKLQREQLRIDREWQFRYEMYEDLPGATPKQKIRDYLFADDENEENEADEEEEGEDDAVQQAAKQQRAANPLPPQRLASEETVDAEVDLPSVENKSAALVCREYATSGQDARDTGRSDADRSVADPQVLPPSPCTRGEGGGEGSMPREAW